MSNKFDDFDAFEEIPTVSKPVPVKRWWIHTGEAWIESYYTEIRDLWDTGWDFQVRVTYS